jgi:hypothetical protein
VLLEVCEELQLTRARYQLAVERYGTVNEILEKAGSPFRLIQRFGLMTSIKLGVDLRTN